MNYSDRIKELRKSKGMEQLQFGSMMGVSGPAVSKWETGKAEPDISAILKMCELFDVSADYLLGRTDYPAFEWRNAKGETKEDEGMVVEEYHFTMNLTKEDMETIREFLALKNAEKKKDHAG